MPSRGARGGQGERCFLHGMMKLQLVGMQGDAGWKATGSAVLQIAQDRTRMVGELDANLMFAARLQANFNQAYRADAT